MFLHKLFSLRMTRFRPSGGDDQALVDALVPT
jgi:hypothetical protein